MMFWVELNLDSLFQEHYTSEFLSCQWASLKGFSLKKFPTLLKKEKDKKGLAMI